MGTPNLQRHFHRDGDSTLFVLDIPSALAELDQMTPDERRACLLAEWGED